MTTPAKLPVEGLSDSAGTIVTTIDTILSSNASSIATSSAITSAILNATSELHVVSVGATNCDFTTIQAAIDSITVVGNDQWLVRVYNGMYMENITLKKGVHIQGVPEVGVIIASTTGDVCTIPTGTGFPMNMITNCKIQHLGTTGNVMNVVSNGMVVLNDATLDITSTGGSTKLINYSGSGSMRVGNTSRLLVAQTTTANWSPDLVVNSGSGTLSIPSSVVQLSTETEEIDTRVFVNTGTGTIEVENNRIDITMKDEACTGSITVIECDDTSVGIHRCHNNMVHIQGTTMGAGFEVDTRFLVANTSDTIRSTGNTVMIRTQGIDSYIFDGISHIVSMHDSLALDNITDVAGMCNGDVEYTSSTVDGYFQASGGFAKSVIGVSSEYDDAEEWKFDVAEVNTTSGDILFTIPADISNWKNGKEYTFRNDLGVNTVEINPNGNTIQGETDRIVVYQNGFVKLQKIGSDLKIVDQSAVSKKVLPTDIPNLEMWLDTTETSSLTLDGSDVDGWNDLHTTNCDFVSTTNKPTMKTNGLSTGRDSMLFSNTDFLNAGVDNLLHDNARGMHIFAIVKPIDSNDYFLGKYTGSGSRTFYLGTNRQRFYDVNNSSYLNTSGIVPRNVWSIVEMRWTPDVSLDVFVNGSQTSSDIAPLISEAGLSTTSPLVIGDSAGIAGYKGEIAGFSAYSRALSEEERRKVLSYWNGKLALDVVPTSILPATWEARKVDIDTSAFTTLPNTTDDVQQLGSDIDTALGSVGGETAIATRTGSYTLLLTDNTILADSTATVIAVTPPLANTCEGKEYTLKWIAGTREVSFVRQGTDTIDGDTKKVCASLLDAIKIKSDGANWWVV